MSNHENNTISELVAKHIHHMWTLWAQDILRTEPNLSPERIQRWEKECFMEYEALSEEMKDLDRKFAREIISLIQNK